MNRYRIQRVTHKHWAIVFTDPISSFADEEGIGGFRSHQAAVEYLKKHYNVEFTSIAVLE